MVVMNKDEVTSEEKLLLCPVCDNKTRTKAFWQTVLVYYPLFCPKCKSETIVNVEYFEVTVIKVPDAKTQSR